MQPAFHDFEKIPHQVCRLLYAKGRWNGSRRLSPSPQRRTWFVEALAVLRSGLGTRSLCWHYQSQSHPIKGKVDSITALTRQRPTFPLPRSSDRQLATNHNRGLAERQTRRSVWRRLGLQSRPKNGSGHLILAYRMQAYCTHCRVPMLLLCLPATYIHTCT